MKRIRRLVVVVSAMHAVACLGGDDARLALAEYARHPPSGLTVVSGSVTLPGKGVWEVIDPLPPQLAGVFLEAPEAVYNAVMGRRGQALQQERQEQDHKSALRSSYWVLSRWAHAHAGRMPTLAELDAEGQKSVERALACLPALPETLLRPPAAPHAALVPDAMLEFKTPPNFGHDYVTATNLAPILVELHPLQDDGKHYVLRANGRIERVPIDVARMESLGLRVVPLTLDPAAGEYPQSAQYRLLARVRAAGECRLSVSNTLTGASMGVLCPVEDAQSAKGELAILKDWAEWREGTWEYLADVYDAPGVRTWAWLQDAMVGRARTQPDPAQGNRRERNATDMMGVLGGRAALRETLQLEALSLRDGVDSNRVPMVDIAGVDVKSHPFEEMLAGREGGRFPIADYVPHDRFFLGVSKPEALLPLLDEGAAFLARVGAGATGRALRYDLKDRYMQALGVTDTLVRTLVENGAIQELALFAPDLFFADGTDLTVIVRMRGAVGVKLLLKLVGVSLGEGGAPVAVKTANGGTAWWGLADELIVTGSQRHDVQSVLALAGKGGVGSLGRSDEFRYMLTRVPPTAQTRAYVYFSDAFIRRLVGPAVKIGQVRRLQEKARMQALAYASMLRAHDGFGRAETVAELMASGYVPAGMDTTGLRLDAGGVPVSATYGPLPRMAGIDAADLSTASAAEATAYAAYKENYTRYWRRFFDPIAMCIDEDGNELVATTYILPLLDNSLYDSVRNVVNADPDVPLRIPRLDPQPTGMLSLNLSETAWREMLRDGLFNMVREFGLDGSALDQLGPAFHFAVFDAEPIIAFGSRSLLGLGGQIGRFDEEMMMIPLMISLLTRPCAMLVELQDAEPVRALLAGGGLARAFTRWEDNIRFTSYQVAGRDSWVVGMDLWGLSLRFSLTVEGKYLIIGNMPWREPIHVAAESEATVSGASIQVTPSAARIELRALHLAAMEGQRQAVMEGLAYLYPLLAAGVEPAAAVDRHRELFGFAPMLPENARLSWDGRVPGYDGFGNLFAEAQPPFDPDAVFGALQGVGNAGASMQFEDTGLRTIVRWRFNAPAP
jgi:hypothetical protein